MVVERPGNPRWSDYGSSSARHFEACISFQDRNPTAALAANTDHGRRLCSALRRDECPFPPIPGQKRPLNVNDSDLSPSMREPPTKDDRITEILFCSIKLKAVDCFHQLKSNEKKRKGPLMSGQPPLVAEQDQVIDGLENRLERRRLKRCDPSITFH
jgi:hypothetical protein